VQFPLRWGRFFVRQVKRGRPGAVAPCKHVTNSNLGDGVDSNEADAINRALTNLHQLAYRSDGTGVGPSRQSQEKAVRRHARTAFFLRALNPGTGHQLGQPCAVGASPAYANPQSTFGSKLFPKSLAIAAPASAKPNFVLAKTVSAAIFQALRIVHSFQE
jgi:hypothetical protein